MSGLTLVGDGTLWGVASAGGRGYGTIYHFDSAGFVTVAHEFNNADGSSPQAILRLGPDNRLYGTTAAGGSDGQGQGTVFRFDPATNELTTVSAFLDANGSQPYGPLWVGTDGFYGTTAYGGALERGVVFRVEPQATAITVEDASGVYGQMTTLSATLTADGTPLQGRMVTFALNDVAVGSVVTDAAGVARLDASLATIDAGIYPASISATSLGDAVYKMAEGRARLVVSPATPIVKCIDRLVIAEGTPLPVARLGCTANVSGRFEYSPAAGTPLSIGTHPVTVTFTPDSGNYKKVTKLVEVQVVPRLVVSDVQPDQGEKIFVASPAIIEWKAADGVGGPARFDVFVSYTLNGPFEAVTQCSGLPGTARSCRWTPNKPSSAAQLKVVGSDHDGNQSSAVSAGTFTMVLGKPLITISSPKADDQWAIGSTSTIAWTHNLGAFSDVRIELQRNNGPWEPIAQSVRDGLSSGSFPWSVPAPEAAASVRVTWWRGEYSVTTPLLSIVRLTFAPDDLVVLDGIRGLLKIDDATGKKTVIRTEPGCCGGQRFAINGDGDIVTVVGGPPRLVRIATETGEMTTISSGQFFKSPNSVAIAPNGAIYVTDHEAQAVIKIDPASGAQELYSSGQRFVAPLSLAIESSGTLVVADSAAEGGTGAVIRVDSTGIQSIVSSRGLFYDPTGIAIDANGDILVADPAGVANQGGRTGQIVRINPVTGVQQPVPSPALIDPWGIAIAENGDIVVSDVAGFTDAAQIVRFNPSTGQGRAVSSAHQLYGPTGVGFAPRVAAPQFTPAPGAFARDITVSIEAPTPRSSIRYTTDGSDPTALNGNAYTGPIPIRATTTVKALAVRQGMASSSVVTGSYARIDVPALAVRIDPFGPTDRQPVTATVSGNLPDSCYAAGAATLAVDGKNLTIEIPINRRSGACLMVIRPYEVSLPLGTLRADHYELTAREVGALQGTAHVSFDVFEDVPSGESNWSQRSPSVSPGTRLFPAMAFDAVRNEVVMFGGMPNPNNVFLNDTWVWDGATWTKRFPSTAPPPRANHSMVYDAARGQVVLFGGYNTRHMGDTWVWDGTNWTQKTTGNAPPARYFGEMAYDAARHEVVLFGGYNSDGVLFGDTWVWDGTTWTQKFPANRPPARQGHRLAYDAAHGEVVLFGGQDTDARGTVFADTWVWNGVNWTQKAPGRTPPARYWHAMAGGSTVALFGGQAQGGRTVFADMWMWDGTTWTPQPAGGSPSGRIFHGMTFDAARKQFVMYGGYSSNGGTILGDTWTWDISSWARQFPASSPGNRLFPAMAFDADRGEVVMFGGMPDPNNAFVNDTWVWNGTTWTRRFPATSPPARADHTIVYDAARHQVLLFGGYNTRHMGDTWVWDGVTWTQKTPANSPPARYFGGMAYDAARGVVVLFGGYASDGTLFGDTWIWDGTTWTQKFPANRPPARQGHRLAYDAAHGEVVLFGGQDTDAGGTVFADTWVWDGANWTQKTPARTPPGRYWHAMAGGETVALFGGQADGGRTVFGDMWMWDGSTWTPQPAAGNPPRRIFHGMTFDAARNQFVMYGGFSYNGGAVLGDTWTWSRSAPPLVPSRPVNAHNLAGPVLYEGISPVPAMASYSGGVLAAFDNVAGNSSVHHIHRSPDGHNIGTGEVIYDGISPVTAMIGYGGGVLTAFSNVAGNPSVHRVHWSPDGNNPGTGEVVYEGISPVTAMTSYHGGVLTAFSNVKGQANLYRVHWSPDGRNLGGGQVVYEGTSRVTAIAAYGDGVLTAFSNVGGNANLYRVHWSPDGYGLGDGPVVYEGVSPVTAMIAYDGGVLTAFSNVAGDPNLYRVHWSPDGKNLGSGLVVYQGSAKVTAMAAYQGKVFAAFSGGGVHRIRESTDTALAVDWSRLVNLAAQLDDGFAASSQAPDMVVAERDSKSMDGRRLCRVNTWNYSRVSLYCDEFHNG